MKNRKLVVGLLVMLAVVMSTLTFAYWATGVTGSDQTATGTIVIGEGDAVTTSVTVANQSSTGNLVPVGYDQDAADVNNVDLTFSVLWDGTGAEGAAGTLAVTMDSIEIDGETIDVSGLFTVTVTSGTGGITAGTAQPVVVNVEFTNEPANAADYALIANGNLIVTLSFDVTAA